MQSEQQDHEEERLWWRKPFRVFQTNLREIDADLDEKAVVGTLGRLGANTWLLNVGGVVSFYPSSLPYQYPSPWLSGRASGDLVGDALEEAHRHGIHVIARCDFSKVHRDIAELHPDWCFVGQDGQPQVYNELHSTCPSASYYQEKSFEILGEILDRYPVDGFFFNWFNFNDRDYSGQPRGICQCYSCKARFAAETGFGLPEVEDWDDPSFLAWREYVRRTLSELAVRLRDFIHARRPEVPLILRQSPDVIMHEVNNAVDRPQPLWVTWAGEVCRRSRAEHPDKPVMINAVTFLDLPYRFTAEQPGFIALELAQTMSQGANPSSYIIGTPDMADERVLEVTADLLGFHRDHEQYYDGLLPSSRVALVTSPRSAEVYGGSDRVSKVEEEEKGLYRALLETHVPFDIVTDAHLIPAEEDGRLARYDALVLANVAILDEQQVECLDRYVAAGGALVATYDSGLFDEQGNEQLSVRLQSLGVERVSFRRQGKSRMRSSYLALTEGALMPGANALSRLALDDAFLYVEPRSGASRHLAFIGPSRYGPPEKCYGEVRTEAPGLVTYRYGEGRTAYFPWPLGGAYYRLAQADVRALLRATLAEVTGGLQVESNAPAQVEICVGEQSATGRTIVHLLNYSGYQGRAFYDPIEVREVRVSLCGTAFGSRALALRSGEELAVEKDADGISFVVPRLGLFEAVVIG